MKRKPKITAEESSSFLAVTWDCSFPGYNGVIRLGDGPADSSYVCVPLIRCTMPRPCGKCWYCKEAKKK